MNDDTHHRLGLLPLTAMVVGSMVGAGIFSLPQTFGRVSGGLGAIIAWAITGTGMLALAFVFQMLARKKPHLDAGIYAYAKDGFGDYLGYTSAFGYWTVCCLGNVSYWVLIKSTLGGIIPAFGDGNTPVAVAISSCGLWVFHALILRGVKQAAALNTLVTIAKIIPIAIFIIIVCLFFDPHIFAANFTGDNQETDSVLIQARDTMLVTVFVFVGIEGASVYSRYSKRREDVGRATLLGFLLVLGLLVSVTLLSYGILPQSELAGLRNPSMAGVLQAAIGPWGALFVSIGLIISVLGAYLSWSLLAAEILYSAARAQTMPSFLAKQNKNGVPSSALWMSSLLIQAFLVISIFSQEAFLLALKLTSSMILIPYFLVAAYALKTTWLERKSGEVLSQRASRLFVPVLATIYTSGLIYAGGLKFLFLSLLVYVPGTILFVISQKELNKPVFKPMEWLLFLLFSLGAIAAIQAMATGNLAL